MENEVCLTKIRYSSKSEAIKVSKHMGRRSGGAFVYPCRTCGDFHITSQPQNVHKQVADKRRNRRRK